MKTQISRDGFRPEKRYSGVYQQQGRMITDRDWNELVDILKSRLDEGMADVVGGGLPRRRALAIAKGSTGGLAITPGVLYSGGLAARVAAAAAAAVPFRFDQQADFPSAPALPANKAYVLYADLWERPVLALEDDELRDPGLNGADTTTRTRTMAQLKWALSPWTPEDPSQNPARGNATVTIGVPAASSGDPLAAVSPVGGDYLFRLEVHDVAWAANDAVSLPNRIVLKWSRENGAEQHKAAEAPGSFKSGPWAYEVFPLAAETHLGFHAVPASEAWRPTRGQLYPSFPLLNPQDAASLLVRRWDGYCVLVRGAAGWSFSTNLPELPQRTAPGAALALANGRLTVRLLDLELAVDLQGRVFLAGDAWQVPVRRAIHHPGDVIAAAAQPTEIVHRYLTLATVNAAGDVTPAAATFPALSDLAAADVRYSGAGCASGLFDATTDTVEQALDRLWQLAAQHAAYAKPADTSLYQGKPVATVRDALNLLSDVRARQIGYDRAGTPDVQSALDQLFLRPSGDANGFTVGAGGDFTTLQTALQTLLAQNRADVRLVLLPGDHDLDTAAPITNPNLAIHLTFTGSGWASRLRVRRPAAFQGMAALTLRSLAIELDPDTFFAVRDGEVNVLDTRIGGLSRDGLIVVGPAARLLVRDNLAEVSSADPTVQPVTILGPMDTVANVQTLFSTREPRLFFLRAQDIVNTIRAMSSTTRTQRAKLISDAIGAAAQDPTFQRALYDQVVGMITATSGPTLDMIPLLAAIRLQAIQRLPGVFLQIAGAAIPTRLENNQIVGAVALYGPPGDNLSGTDLTDLAGRLGDVLFDPAAAADLVATGNRMSGIAVGSATIAALRKESTIAPLYRRIALTENTLDGGANQLAAATVELDSNLLTTDPFGWVVGEETLFLGNAARALVNLDTVTRNAVQAANSANVKVRWVSGEVQK